MTEPCPLQVEQSVKNLVECLSGLGFSHRPFVDYAVVELSIGTMLHEDVYAILFAKHLIDLDDVLVHQALMKFNFNLSRLLCFNLKTPDFQDFDSNNLSCGSMYGPSDLGEAPCPNSFL